MWQDISTLTLDVTGKWFFTEVINQDFSLIQLQHDLTNAQDVEQIRPGAFIALFYGENIYNPKTFVYREIGEIINFSNLPIEQKPRIGIKRLDDLNLIWNVEIKIMPIYDATSNNALISTKKEKLEANVIQKVFKQEVDNFTSINETRRGLSIFNSSYTATVTIGLSASESDGILGLDGVLAVIPPRKIYELPTIGDGSCYSGVVYGKSDVADTENYLELTEFVAALE